VVEPPEAVIQALVDSAGTRTAGAHRYMQNAGYPEVRDAVAAYLAERTNLPFAGAHIVMCVGAGGGLNVIFKSILDEGDEVICLSPFFVEYRFYIGNHGGTSVLVPTDAEFQPDLAAIEAAITPKTKAVVINSPNNPTGVTYTRERLDALGDLLRAKSAETGRLIYLVTDEPYRNISYDGVEVPWVFDSYDDTILVTSHSKDLALPGERIGFIACSPNLEPVDQMVAGLTFATRTLGFVNAPATQQRAIASLQGISVDPEIYRRKRDIILPALREMGYEIVQPTGAFYLFPKSMNPDDVAFVRELQEELILTVPGTGFGRPGHFRIAYCVADETIERSLPSFAKVAARYR
jgi:aspartate aminotransferase